MSTNRIISRAEWGARYGRGSAGASTRSEVIIHTTVTALMSENASQASEASVMRGMENYHVQNRGFNGIAYTFCISDSGRIYEARGWTRDGAHTQNGGNTKGYGIAFIGDGTKRAPSRKAWNALVWLLGTGIDSKYITSKYRVSGHRDWWRKECPGDLIYSVMHAEAGGVKSAPSRPQDWMFGPGDNDSDDVRTWQQQLVDGFGASISIDGDFGPLTESATKDFEKTYELKVNGYVSDPDVKAMEALYAKQAEMTAEGGVDEEETPPEDVSPVPVLGRHYREGVRFSRNPADERIARAIGAALHLHVARFDDDSTTEISYLVGGQAVREYDSSRTEDARHVAGATRMDTLDAAVEVIREYLKTL